MDLETFPRVVTIYGRAAFLLSMAERVVPVLTDEPGYSLATRAFSEAVRWLGGVRMSGYILTDLIHNANDEGLNIYAQECRNETSVNAYNCLITVLCYFSFHMSLQVGEYPDAMLVNVTEECILDAHGQASAVDSYDEDYVRRVYDYVISMYRIVADNERGDPIDLEVLKAHVM